MEVKGSHAIDCLQPLTFELLSTSFGVQLYLWRFRHTCCIIESRPRVMTRCCAEHAS